MLKHRSPGHGVQSPLVKPWCPMRQLLSGCSLKFGGNSIGLSFISLLCLHYTTAHTHDQFHHQMRNIYMLSQWLFNTMYSVYEIVHRAWQCWLSTHLEFWLKEYSGNCNLPWDLVQSMCACLGDVLIMSRSSGHQSILELEKSEGEKETSLCVRLTLPHSGGGLQHQSRVFQSMIGAMNWWAMLEFKNTLQSMNNPPDELLLRTLSSVMYVCVVRSQAVGTSEWSYHFLFVGFLPKCMWSIPLPAASGSSVSYIGLVPQELGTAPMAGKKSQGGRPWTTSPLALSRRTSNLLLSFGVPLLVFLIRI